MLQLLLFPLARESQMSIKVENQVSIKLGFSLQGSVGGGEGKLCNLAFQGHWASLTLRSLPP